MALPAAAQELIALRAQARAARDFTRSDQLREELLALKIRVKDGADGQSWEVIP
jgi:cysteinyl-tRNA synthetase